MNIFCGSSVMSVVSVISVMRVMSCNVFTYECYLCNGFRGYYEECEH